MRQFEHDTYSMMTRFLDPDRAIVAIDVGANVGDTCRRITQEFPHAIVHALEPVSDVFRTLEERTADMPGVKRYQIGVSDREGTVKFNVTKNRWCSSILPPSELGKAYYGEWYEVERQEEARIVRLDDWAKQQGIDQIDILKIDVQGLELAALRGAEALLSVGGERGVKAINCEAQLVAEYEGAATFAEIDLYLRSKGFTLHQIHELQVKGEELQSSYLDAMWLRNDVLAALRKSPRRTYEPGCVVRTRKALARCAEHGRKRVALYGSGQHTNKIAAALENPPVEIVGIIDDNPARQGQTMLGLPIISAERAMALGVQGVILSSDGHEAKLWEQSASFRKAGVPVLPLYGQYHTDVPVEGPAVAFREDQYLRLNAARLEHLHALGLDVFNKRVLEVGAGVGDLTGFFAQRGCEVVSTDARPANLDQIARQFRGNDRVRTALLDLDQPKSLDAAPPGGFDITFCYGLLYHLTKPELALAYLANQTRGVLLLETCVSFGEHEAVNPTPELNFASQALDGMGCRPTRSWVWSTLKRLFPHVYVTRTQPAHEQFPLDWSAPGACGRRHELARSVFVASRMPIVNRALCDTLIARHEALAAARAA